MSGEYTPNTEAVKDQYTREQPPQIGTVSEKAAEFDYWLAGELAAAEKRGAVKALREAADKFGEGEWLDAFVAGNSTDDVSAVQATTRWLYDRADQIESATKPSEEGE